jgi:hypothetical protein
MPNDKHISDRFSEIATLISDGKNWANFDRRLDAHLAAYVCVLLSGAIEDAIERMISIKMGALGDSETERYVIKVVGLRFRNPDWGAMNGLLGDFSDEYKLAWTSRFPAGSRVDESLRSINNIKNALAHTGSNSLYVTLLDVQSYFDDVLPAVDHLEQIVLPHPPV